MACKVTHHPFQFWQHSRGGGGGDHPEPKPSCTHTHILTHAEPTVVRFSLQGVWEGFKCKVITGCGNTRVGKALSPERSKECLRAVVFSGCKPSLDLSSACFHRYYYKTGILERVDRRLVYKFGKNAHGWQEDKL